MKSTYMLSAILLVFILIIPGCKEETPEPDELTLQLNALMEGSPWSLTSQGVVKDGYDVTDQFAGFMLSLAIKHSLHKIVFLQFGQPVVLGTLRAQIQM
ncbi:MAG: hypothetical protein HC811_12750 [Flammeovirgaceae bacterium]|nr:hypothetical protein [Flammeovirgaceae bacterium]